MLHFFSVQLPVVQLLPFEMCDVAVCFKKGLLIHYFGNINMLTYVFKCCTHMLFLM